MSTRVYFDVCVTRDKSRSPDEHQWFAEVFEDAEKDDTPLFTTGWHPTEGAAVLEAKEEMRRIYARRKAENRR